MFFVDALLKVLKPRYDDENIDRLNYYYTPFIMCLFAILIGGKQYFGQPIQCWVPAQFTGAWEQYTEYYCFVQNTYFVRMREPIPFDYTERENKEIGYYQWVPFVLALQSLLFFMPILIWRMFNWHSGIRAKNITSMAVDVNNMESETRDKNVKVVAAHLQASLDLQRDLKPAGRMFGFLFYGKHYGNYVSGLYLFVKILFIVNVVCQFFLLNSFLGPQYTFWGLEILRDLTYGKPWEESGHFPRVTMCDFDVRVLGNTHRHSVQCVLLVNMFNEKIYLFLWWWFFVVAILTCINFLYWMVVCVAPGLQRSFIQRYLRVTEDLTDSPADQRQLQRFVHRNLRPDGVLLIRLIATNGGELIATELVHEMWRMFAARNRLPPPPSMTGGPKEDADHPAGFVENLYAPDEKRGGRNDEKTPLRPGSAES